MNPYRLWKTQYCHVRNPCAGNTDPLKTIRIIAQVVLIVKRFLIIIYKLRFTLPFIILQGIVIVYYFYF